MSSTQKKINLNNLLASGESKNSLNEKVKNRNYKQFIKRIKANSTEKLEFSVIKNQNNSNYQQQNNLLTNFTNLNNNFTNAHNNNNPNLTNQLQNLNFQSTNFSVNSKEKVNERYGGNNFHTQGNNILEKKISEKRAKSGLATSLTNLEILRKNQESRVTNSNSDMGKIPNSNESNPSSSSNKIDIKISFNYSKNNSLNNNKSSIKNLTNSNNMNSLPYQANTNSNNITNNHITNNNYANYYLRYKNLSKPNNPNGTNNCINNNYSNVNTSNNYDYMNTYSHMNTSINNKTTILNTSYMHNTNKPTILQDTNHNNTKAESISKNKNLINVNKSANLNFHSINSSNFLKKKIIENNDSEITSDDIKNLNNSVSKGKINKISTNKAGVYVKKPQSESHFYQNNLNISINNNIDNKPIITNYYSKTKGNNNSFAFNENMLEKINRGMNSISLTKNINNNVNDFYNSKVEGTDSSTLINSISNPNNNNNINNNLNSINNTNSTGLDYNSALLTNSASSENLITTGKTNDSTNQNLGINSDGNLNSEDSTKNQIKNEEFTLNRKNNDFIEILDNINIRETTNNNNNNNLESNLNLLEKKLEQKLIAIKQENEKNKILNLTKKYSAYKTIFEESIKTINECNNIKNNNLLHKILNGYNDTVQTLFMNFSKLHEKYTEGESVYQNYKNLSRKYTDLFKSYESKCEEIKKIQLKNLSTSVDLNEKDKNKIIINEELQDSTDNLLQSQFVNFNPGNSTSNLNQNFINNTNESVILKQNNKNNPNVKSHFSNNNLNISIAKRLITDKSDVSVDYGNANKTFANIQPQKNTLDFSQIKIDTENSVIFNNNNNNEKNLNMSSIKENMNSLNNNLNQNSNNINVVRLKLSDADLPTEEELINQKNAKIMLRMIGKNNLDDLDSIYFFDKINMRSNSASITKVPKLDFNVMKVKLRRNEENQNQANYIHQQMINNSHINYQNNNNYNMNNIHQMQNLKKNNLKLDDINYYENPKHINFTTSNKNFMKINNLNVSTNNYNQLKNSQIIKESTNPNVYMKKLNASINIDNKKK